MVIYNIMNIELVLNNPKPKHNFETICGSAICVVCGICIQSLIFGRILEQIVLKLTK